MLTDELLDMIRETPSLGNPLPGADDYLEAEVVYAARFESALHLEDVLARRTRISIEAWDRGVSAAPVAARLRAPSSAGTSPGFSARSTSTLSAWWRSAPASWSPTTSPPTACAWRPPTSSPAP